jgi:hypothetical protein
VESTEAAHRAVRDLFVAGDPGQRAPLGTKKPFLSSHLSSVQGSVRLPQRGPTRSAGRDAPARGRLDAASPQRG